MKRVAINGMGRTGRFMVRELALHNQWDIELVAVNDVADPENIAYLLKYDSVHGRLHEPVSYADGWLQIGAARVRIYQKKDPRQLPWAELKVDTVIEASGQFTSRQAASAHLDAGAARVLIGAPAPDADLTLVMGVNHRALDPTQHKIISNASCTTNSLAPVLKLLDDAYGIEEVLATTVHAYTASQAVVDKAAKKMHRGRAAALSMIPTSTGADAATVAVLPQLKDRIRVLALRVPTPNVSITDISARLREAVDASSLNKMFKQAAAGSMAGILGYSDDELVSVDLVGEPASCLIHGRATVCAGNMVKVFAWYDNEAGYSHRCLDVVGKLNF